MQSWTKLPGIAAAKPEALPVIGAYPRRGKLSIQTSLWWSLAYFWQMNHHGVWLSVAIEADELIFRPTAPLREDIGLKP